MMKKKVPFDVLLKFYPSHFIGLGCKPQLWVTVLLPISEFDILMNENLYISQNPFARKLFQLVEQNPSLEIFSHNTTCPDRQQAYVNEQLGRIGRRPVLIRQVKML